MLLVFRRYLGYLVIAESLFFVFFAVIVAEGKGLLTASMVFIPLSLLALLVLETKAALVHRAFLSVLYTQCRPKAFLEIYSPLLEQKRIRRNVRYSMTSTLCKAYITAGDFQRALDTLDTLPEYHGNPMAAAIEASNRCLIYLSMGLTAAAQGHYVDFCRESSRLSSGRGMATVGRLLQIQLDLVAGHIADNGDTAFLRGELGKDGSVLYKAELKFLLARLCETSGEKERSQLYYGEVAALNRELWISRKSAAKVADLEV